MANSNTPFGFKPLRSLAGGECIVNYYRVLSSASRIAKGDLVKLTSSGTVERETSATAVGPWIGVAMKDSGTISAAIQYFPVCDDPNAVFEVMSAKTSAHAITDLNQNLKVDNSTAIDSNYGTSKGKMTTTATTGSNGVRLLRIIDDISNESGAYQRVEVRLNAHYSAPGTAAV